MQPSDLVVVRSAGNTHFRYAIADGVHGVYAEHTLIMVMGHSACGTVNAARNDAPLTSAGTTGRSAPASPQVKTWKRP